MNIKKTVLNFTLSLISIAIAFSADVNTFDKSSDINTTDNVALSATGSKPNDPSMDRARGYLTKGKFQSAIGNYGTFIDWDHNPSGLWGDYQYFPALGFMFGVPGSHYAHQLTENTLAETTSDWYNITSSIVGGSIYYVYKSSLAYDLWIDGSTENFSGVLFNMGLESETAVFEPIVSMGDSTCSEEIIISNQLFNGTHQWVLCQEEQALYISVNEDENLSLSSSRIGFIYPWAKRPTFKKRELTSPYRDEYEYGNDGDAWTEDDEYSYYGANVAESWFKGELNTDWQPSWGSRGNTHGTTITSGDIYGGEYTSPDDSYPMLATSTLPETWPTHPETNLPTWPGWYAEILQEGSGGGVDGVGGTVEVGTFISDEDVYMEFDDRWSHRGNPIELGEEYENMGYPLGIKVKAMAHSYGVAFAEDVAFFTVKVSNESGDYIDENGNFQEGMMMPDGTQLNKGKGFNYRNASMGFYFDVDSYSANADGSYGGRSNDDDMMGFDKDFRFAYIYDLDDNSYGATNLAYSAVKLLDTPLSAGYVDTDGDGSPDISPGDTLGMTDWHHFSWYARPGVVEAESNTTSCYAGSEGCPVAKNKEEIQFKVMTGDTTNLSSEEHDNYFHTADMDEDDPSALNPHFDSMDGLLAKYDEGLDCVLMMSCGPFDLDVGQEVFFSFAVIMGQNLDDLRNNATMAQLMYDESYQGFSPPTTPEVYAVAGHEVVTLYWDNVAELSKDRITNYEDFQGYRVYKSVNGGNTWGNNAYDMIFDSDGIHVGWKPLAQFDLTYEQDVEKFGKDISGSDPLAPWISLGTNNGIVNSYVDSNVVDGVEYTYSVTAYDMGVDADYTVEWEYQDSTLVYEYDQISLPDSVVYYVFGSQFGSFGSSDENYLTDIEENCAGLDNYPNCGSPFEFNECCDTISTFLGTVAVDSSWVKTGFYAADTIYNDITNPDHWASPHGLVSLESPKGTSFRDKNYVEVVPGFKPTNVTNPDIDLGDNPFEELTSFGNGNKYFTIINEETHAFENDGGINDKLYRYQVVAEASPTSYKNLDLNNPMLFAYEVENNGESYEATELIEQVTNLYLLDVDTTVSPYDTSIVIIDGSYVYADTSFLNYPGTEIISQDINTGQVVYMQPNYSLKEFHIGYESDENYDLNWSEFHNGLMVRFDNPPKQERQFTKANKVKELGFNVSGIGDPSCLELEMHAKDYPQNDIQKFYDYYIVFGDSSIAYKGGAASNYQFNVPNPDSKCHQLSSASSCDMESGCEWSGEDNYCFEPKSGLGRCYDDLVPYDWKYPFSIYNVETNDPVYLGPSSNTYDHDNNPDTSPIEITNYVRGLEIRFLESGVTDPTYYPHSHAEQGSVGECDDFLYMTFMMNLDLITLPYSDINCPGDPCCLGQGETEQDAKTPWQYNSTDEIAITMKRNFSDGDSWILDMSEFGKAEEVTQEDLEQVKVVPNPYIVSSGMNETKYSKRMAFTKLPERCTIKIFTISGELIRVLEHDDTFLSSKFWDLRTENNQEVSPGLYIYTVESDGKKHISKFAVVR